MRARRRFSLLGAVAFLAAASVVFFRRQKASAQIGGPMSVPKLLWLDYALVSWYLVPFFFWKSPRIAPALRRVYGLHLASFVARGAAELPMLYVTVSWSPVYGIAHDLLDALIITTALRHADTPRTGPAPRSPRSPSDREREGTPGVTPDVPANAAARHFLTSIRIGLACEIAFAALFHRARAGQSNLYFASSDPSFAFINLLTTAAVLALYPDLIWTVWKGRDALLPAAAAEREARPAQG